MRVRLLVVLAVLALAHACGTPKPTEQQLCGDTGCDSCIGASCPADAGP